MKHDKIPQWNAASGRWVAHRKTGRVGEYMGSIHYFGLDEAWATVLWHGAARPSCILGRNIVGIGDWPEKDSSLCMTVCPKCGTGGKS